MRLNKYNEERVARLLALVESFDGSVGELDGLQAQLQSEVSLLENDGSGVAELVRLAEADVEEIRFTRLLEDQGAAAVLRMRRLATDLGGLMA